MVDWFTVVNSYKTRNVKRAVSGYVISWYWIFMVTTLLVVWLGCCCQFAMFKIRTRVNFTVLTRDLSSVSHVCPLLILLPAIDIIVSCVMLFSLQRWWVSSTSRDKLHQLCAVLSSWQRWSQRHQRVSVFLCLLCFCMEAIARQIPTKYSLSPTREL